MDLNKLRRLAGIPLKEDHDWSEKVEPKTHPEEGTFTKSAEDIVHELMKVHEGDATKALEALNFYINRAGEDVSNRDELEKAKTELEGKLEVKEEDSSDDFKVGDMVKIDPNHWSEDRKPWYAGKEGKITDIIENTWANIEIDGKDAGHPIHLNFLEKVPVEEAASKNVETVLGHFKDVPSLKIMVVSAGKDAATKKPKCDVVIQDGDDKANRIVMIRSVNRHWTSKQTQEYIEKNYADKIQQSGGVEWSVEEMPEVNYSDEPKHPTETEKDSITPDTLPEAESSNSLVGKTVTIKGTNGSMDGCKGKVVWSNDAGTEHEVALDGKEDDVHGFSTENLQVKMAESDEVEVEPEAETEKEEDMTDDELLALFDTMASKVEGDFDKDEVVNLLMKAYQAGCAGDEMTVDDETVASDEEVPAAELEESKKSSLLKLFIAEEASFKPYYTLLQKHNDKWGIEFGSYDRADVSAEFQDYRDHGTKTIDLKIIKTSAEQKDIDAEVAKLNGETKVTENSDDSHIRWYDISDMSTKDMEKLDGVSLGSDGPGQALEYGENYGHPEYVVGVHDYLPNAKASEAILKAHAKPYKAVEEMASSRDFSSGGWGNRNKGLDTIRAFKAGQETFDMPNGDVYKAIKMVHGDKLEAGMIVLAAHNSTNQGAEVYEILGFTGHEGKYGDGGVKFKSVRELLAHYNVGSLRDLNILQDENSYENHSYLVVKDLETNEQGPWFYLYNGKWSYGSGAEPLTFTLAEKVVTETPAEVEEGEFSDDDLNDMLADKEAQADAKSRGDVDVRDLPPGTSVDHNLWPDKLFYKGNNVFRTVYEHGEPLFDTAIKKRIDVHRFGLGDAQECYLGYVPEDDIFILGYDGWGDEEKEDPDKPGYTLPNNLSPYFEFRILDNGQINIMVFKNASDEDLWYHGGYDEIKKKYPGIVDIRLD